MNESRGSERGSIQPRRGALGLGGMLDWDPFRGLISGGWQQMLGLEMIRRDDGYEIEMAVPGYRPEDLDVTYQDGVVTITGRNDKRHFTRSFTIPEDVDEEKISANVELGMLTLLLRQVPKRQARHIAVTGTTEQRVVESGTKTSK